MAAAEPFPEANLVLGPPPGLEESVIALSALRRDGCIVSCWRLSADELAEVTRTGVVWLSVMGRLSAPPVYVAGLKADVVG